MSDDDAMDVEAVREQLARAVGEQLGSLVTLNLLAGTARGTAAAGLKDRLLSFAVSEVHDTQRLVEKLVALGGQLQPYEPPPLPAATFDAAAREFLEREQAVMSTLHAVIGPSGQTPASEALEHLIEHVLLRKQQQVDFLRLALD